MKTFKINEDLAQGLMDYLSRRPYIEVMPFIAALQQLEAVDKPETKELDTKK